MMAQDKESCFWCDVNKLVRESVKRTYLVGFTDGHDADGKNFMKDGEIAKEKIDEWMGEVLVEALGISDHKEDDDGD